MWRASQVDQPPTRPSPTARAPTYRKVRISSALPDHRGGLHHEQWFTPELNVTRNECFFRNEPLRSLDDELLYPALLNCSVMKGSQ
jgi:hypothetical protein